MSENIAAPNPANKASVIILLDFVVFCLTEIISCHTFFRVLKFTN